MKTKWNNIPDAEVYNRIELMEKFAAFLRKEFAVIAEEHRSLGFLNESIGQALLDASPGHFPQTQALVTKFVGSLEIVEGLRKLLYHRSHLLAQSAFQPTLEHAKLLKPRVRERDHAVGRYLAAVTADSRGNDPKVHQKLLSETAAYQALNLQTIQGVCSFHGQMNRDLVGTLTSFAHAQMELYVKTIQTWTETISEFENMQAEQDAEAIEEGMKKILLSIPGLAKPGRSTTSDDEAGTEASTTEDD
jgi:hypothetical protein